MPVFSQATGKIMIPFLRGRGRGERKIKLGRNSRGALIFKDQVVKREVTEEIRKIQTSSRRKI